MKLKGDISLAQIQKFRGVVDFYYWKGIACARSWPCKPMHPGTPAQRATWNAFRDMMAWKKSNPNSWNLQWRKMFLPVGRSHEDVMRKFGLRLAYANNLTRPPDVGLLVVSQFKRPDRTRIEIQITPYAGWDPTKVFWYIRGFNGAPDGLVWYLSEKKQTRQGTILPMYEPLFTGYQKETGQPIPPLFDHYQFWMDGIWDHVNCIPIAEGAHGEDVMIGAIYSGRILTGG